ncbi:MAG: substrate-binding domain-containing protein [Rhodobacter sp.]|jgi:tungstate transport system substrate-binding protein|nr:substrate-binding domain-containing protein [Rhodobacter sp.]
MIRVLVGLFALIYMSAAASAEDLKLAVTTSFENSGLAGILLPEIKADTGIDVQLIVVGTGQAIRLGKAGDVDAILVHSRQAEEAFLAAGFGTHRREIMYNDFVLIGPSDDPAGISDAKTVVQAVQRIADTESAFVSRGDDSGTHKSELSIWSASGLNVASFGDWYRSVGAGMGAALVTASGMNAYILSDRASWLKFGKKAKLKLLFSGDPALFNQYAYLPVNPQIHPHVRNDLAMQLEAWLVSDRAKYLIENYRINGESLFTFNASPQ